MDTELIPVEDNRRAAPTVPEATAGTPGKIVIIGGGIAGLSCGCYLQMNGLQTEILEAGLLPGGLCTAWHRGPYVFDGCLRWLLGTNPSSAFHQIWTELGAIAGREILSHDEVMRIEGRPFARIQAHRARRLRAHRSVGARRPALRSARAAPGEAFGIDDAS